MLTIEPILFYAMVLVVVALVLLAIAAVVLYVRLSQKHAELLQEINKPKGPQVDPEVLLNQARQKSQKILEDAHTRSQAMLANTENFLDASNTELAKQLQSANQTYANMYAKTLEELQQQASGNLQNLQNEVFRIMQSIPNDIKNQFSQELTGVKTMISEEIQKAEQNAKNIVVNAYKNAEAEVQKYKQERLKQVEGSIVLILQEIAKRVLMKEINTDEHEKLVIKALEEAKQQGVFGGSVEEEARSSVVQTQKAQQSTPENGNGIKGKETANDEKSGVDQVVENKVTKPGTDNDTQVPTQAQDPNRMAQMTTGEKAKNSSSGKTVNQ